MVIAGVASNVVSIGVYELLACILRTRFVHQGDPMDMQAVFDNLPEFAIIEAPSIDNRGIRSCGYPFMAIGVSSTNMAIRKMIVPANIGYSEKLERFRTAIEFVIVPKGFAWLVLNCQAPNLQLPP